MTVKELRHALVGLPADAEVYMVRDWEIVDEFGNLTDLLRLTDLNTQRVAIDDGIDFHDEVEVLLEFNEL